MEKNNSKFVVFGKKSENPIVLAHANAYFPEMYTKFITSIGNPYVIAPKHRPLWQPEASSIRDWSIFANDLILFMDDQKLSNVVCIGHSLGAVALWRASTQRPDLFKKIILIDPVVLPQDVVLWLRYLPYALKRRMRPIIAIAAARRDQWLSREEAREHLGARKVFKRFEPDVFDTFITHGIIPDPKGNGYTLAFPRAWESYIYASPDNIWRYMHKGIVPIHIIRAENTDVMTSSTWEKLKTLPAPYTFEQINGVGHLVPFENTQRIADIILAQLDL